MSKQITIIIEKLEFKSIIGLLKKERYKKQKVQVYAKILVDHEDENFLNYATVCEKIKNTIKTEKFFTVEEALIKTSREIYSLSTNIKEVNLSIFKPNILNNVKVGAQFHVIY